MKDKTSIYVSVERGKEQLIVRGSVSLLGVLIHALVGESVDQNGQPVTISGGQNAQQ